MPTRWPPPDSSGGLAVFAVASPYAWDVVETARRQGLRVRCVDNHGGADERLPGLVSADDVEAGPFTLGLSSAAGRAGAAVAAQALGYVTPLVLVDPTSAVASTATLGHGAYVNAGAVVASHALLGCHVNVNRSASVGHDSSLGFAASLGPGAVLAGGVRLADRAFIGAGATVLPERSIGLGAVVGAGAVAIRDVEDWTVVAGNPARVLRTLEPTRTWCVHTAERAGCARSDRARPDRHGAHARDDAARPAHPGRDRP